MNLFRSTSCKRLLAVFSAIVLTGWLSCDRNKYSRVWIKTDLGDLLVEIYPDQAPFTATNFLSHVEKGTYTNSVFYRVVRMDNQPENQVKIEVIQGGLFDDKLIDTHVSIAHETTEETGISHRDGVISMARNEPGTASTEFFICIGDQPSLDYHGDRNPDGQGFAAFGKIILGMDVVRTIQNLADDNQYLNEKVVIREISLQR
ncbi:MAG: peptidylprolyl isomerase [Bacteroidota bacterium]